jgi:hypothetical protein
MSRIILWGALATVLLSAAATVPGNADGGTPPYECELVAGQLPPGLAITGCATAPPPPTEALATPHGSKQESATIKNQLRRSGR